MVCDIAGLCVLADEIIVGRFSGNLPADGSTHGFDKHREALDVSHVNIAKYLEAADHILNYSIATGPEPPTIQRRRISLANRGGFIAHIIMNGDGLLLKDKQPDPDFPPAAEQNHFDQGAHEQWGSFRNGASVGVFRHEDESVSPYFAEHVMIYPARYRVRTSRGTFQRSHRNSGSRATHRVARWRNPYADSRTDPQPIVHWRSDHD